MWQRSDAVEAQNTQGILPLGHCALDAVRDADLLQNRKISPNLFNFGFKI